MENIFIAMTIGFFVFIFTCWLFYLQERQNKLIELINKHEEQNAAVRLAFYAAVNDAHGVLHDGGDL